MNLGKIIILASLTLIIIWFSLCAFGPSKLDIQDSRLMDLPKEKIYKNVIDMSQWKNWITPFNLDTTTNIILSEPPSGIGAKLKYESITAGNGDYRIVEADENQIKIKFNFQNWPRTVDLTWTFQEKNGNTLVSYHMSDYKKIPFISRGILSFFSLNKTTKGFMHEEILRLHKLSRKS